MTKTCLEVLTNLGKAFQSAVKEGPEQPKTVSPYMVQNDTGLVITLLLNKGSFKVKINDVIPFILFCVHGHWPFDWYLDWWWVWRRKMKVPVENLYNFQCLRLGVSSDVMPCSLIERSIPGFQKIAASVVITRSQDLKFQKALVFSLLFHS